MSHKASCTHPVTFVRISCNLGWVGKGLFFLSRKARKRWQACHLSRLYLRRCQMVIAYCSFFTIQNIKKSRWAKLREMTCIYAESNTWSLASSNTEKNRSEILSCLCANLTAMKHLLGYFLYFLISSRLATNCCGVIQDYRNLETPYCLQKKIILSSENSLQSPYKFMFVAINKMNPGRWLQIVLSIGNDILVGHWDIFAWARCAHD